MNQCLKNSKRWNRCGGKCDQICEAPLCVWQYPSCTNHPEMPFQLSIDTISLGYCKTSFIPRPSPHGPCALGGWGTTSMVLALQHHTQEVASPQQASLKSQRCFTLRHARLLSRGKQRRPHHQPTAFSPARLCRWAHPPRRRWWLWGCSLAFA